MTQMLFMNGVHHQNQTQIRDGNVKKMMTIGKKNSIGQLKMKKLKNIKRCGYTPYGYKACINNRHMEFATEYELDEYIKEFDYGFINDV